MLSPEAKQKIQDHIAAMPESLRRDPATEQELREFEESYGPIPEDYRWFLLTCGGGHFGAEAVDDITELAKSHAKLRREFGPPRGWTMRDVFIIGCQPEDHYKFTVLFTAPRGFSSTDSVSGQLELRAGEETISRISFWHARPAARWKYVQGMVEKLPLGFSVTVRREHLATSKVSISHVQADNARADDYWFYLKDFAHQQ